ncbi:F-box only protein 9-like [Actinia tenebrosa]|uniref:F-box only protein 9 n=1 Tax=Actinia tenebrosa TaxID=6105 RepID=A0A6P8HRP2_ACTTE|nr:F-box only protein 9-like [Actinia tenebrosa]
MENKNVEEELASFRREWKEELHSRENAAGRQSPNVSTEGKTNKTYAKVLQEKAPVKTNQSKALCNTQTTSSLKESDDVVSSVKLPQLGDKEDGSVNIKEKAEKLFRKAASLEKNGLAYEALKFYRKAIQLVPDIEFTITDFSSSSDEEDHYDDDYVIKESAINIPGISSLAHGIHNLSLSGFHLCEKEYESRATHISDIPVELLMYIFKWVVSTSLDFRSLEQVSMVCKGFYVCARDTEIWKLGCQRMWGVNCGSPVQWDHGSWRLMFINRPHLWTQGIYISKTTYMRPSEKVEDIWSMQLVTYYRYLRFFNDGAVHVVTTPDEPQIVVPRFSQPGLSMMQGHYKILGNKVVIILDVDSPIDSHYRARKGKRSGHSKLLENTFRMELEIRSTSRRRRHNQLKWVRYTHCKTYRDTGQTVVSEFDITSQFPPFSYSPVRSYTQTALAPLV